MWVFKEEKPKGFPRRKKSHGIQGGRRSRVSKEEEPGSTLEREDPEYPMRKRSQGTHPGRVSKKEEEPGYKVDEPGFQRRKSQGLH